MKRTHGTKRDAAGLPIVRYPRQSHQNAKQRRDIKRRAAQILRTLSASLVDGAGR